MLTAPATLVASSAQIEFAVVDAPTRKNRKWKPAHKSALTGRNSTPKQSSYVLDSEVVRVMNGLAKQYGLSRSALMDKFMLEGVQAILANGKI